MIHLSTLTNNNIAFSSKKKVSESENHTDAVSSSGFSKILIPTALFLASFNPISAQQIDTYSNTISTEIVENMPAEKESNPTALSLEELQDAPSPEIVVAGKKQNAGIVVDLSSNKLYRYDSDGDVIDGYKVATGAIGSNGKSITGTGIREVDHIETYPYKGALGTKRIKNPKAYGPKLLYLTTIDPKTGANLGSNGEFIHGNNDASSIGEYASGGCIRMDNEVIKQFAKEVKPGTLVLIK